MGLIGQVRQSVGFCVDCDGCQVSEVLEIQCVATWRGVLGLIYSVEVWTGETSEECPGTGRGVRK
jgi:hypothetical protein